MNPPIRLQLVIAFEKNIFLLKFRGFSIKSSIICLGGTVVLPKSKDENDNVTAIAELYYEKCDAHLKSGKTIWVGVKNVDKAGWKVIKGCQRTPLVL